jgi:putative endonuclease
LFYVYVLRSLRNGKRYVGYSGKAPVEKLAEHNGGATRWTRNNRPLKLVHYEEYDDPKVAKERERFLKSGRGSNGSTTTSKVEQDPTRISSGNKPVNHIKKCHKSVFPGSSVGRAVGCKQEVAAFRREAE